MSNEIAQAGFVINPWWAIWIRPRAAVQQVLSSDPRYAVLALAAIGGLLSLFKFAEGGGLASFIPFVAVLAVISLGGPLLGVLKLYLGGLLVARIGRSFGGTGTARHARAALAWGSIPAVAGSLVFATVLIAQSGPFFVNEEFEQTQAELRTLFWSPLPANEPETSPGPLAGALLAGASLLVLSGFLWTVVTTIKTTAEAHGFSSWRALVTLTVTWLTVGLVVVVPYLTMVSVAVIADALG